MGAGPLELDRVGRAGLDGRTAYISPARAGAVSLPVPAGAVIADKIGFIDAGKVHIKAEDGEGMVRIAVLRHQHRVRDKIEGDGVLGGGAQGRVQVVIDKDGGGGSEAIIVVLPVVHAARQEQCGLPIANRSAQRPVVRGVRLDRGRVLTPGIIDSVDVLCGRIQRIQGGLQRNPCCVQLLLAQRGIQYFPGVGEGLGEVLPCIGGVAVIISVLVGLIECPQCAAIKIELLDQGGVVGQDRTAYRRAVPGSLRGVGRTVLRPHGDGRLNGAVHVGLGVLAAARRHGPVELVVERTPAHTIIVGGQAGEVAVAVIDQAAVFAAVVVVQHPIGHEGALHLLEIGLIAVGHAPGLCVGQTGAQKEKAVSGKNGIHLFT